MNATRGGWSLCCGGVWTTPGDWGVWVGAGTDGIILAAGGMSGLHQMPFSRTFVVAQWQMTCGRRLDTQLVGSSSHSQLLTGSIVYPGLHSCGLEPHGDMHLDVFISSMAHLAMSIRETQYPLNTRLGVLETQRP